MAVASSGSAQRRRECGELYWSLSGEPIAHSAGWFRRCPTQKLGVRYVCSLPGATFSLMPIFAVLEFVLPGFGYGFFEAGGTFGASVPRYPFGYSASLGSGFRAVLVAPATHCELGSALSLFWINSLARLAMPCDDDDDDDDDDANHPWQDDYHRAKCSDSAVAARVRN